VGALKLAHYILCEREVLSTALGRTLMIHSEDLFIHQKNATPGVDGKRTLILVPGRKEYWERELSTLKAKADHGSHGSHGSHDSHVDRHLDK